MTRASRLLSALVIACAFTGCVPLEYDLTVVPVPISAKPAEAGADVTPLRLSFKNTLWVHGLFGHSQPDVAAAIAEAAQGYDRIADFRIKQAGGFHDWLLTHVSATLVRMKTVTVEAQLVREPAR